MGLDFQALVDAYYEPLYRFALSLAKSEAEAADLTQQTFYRWAAKGHQLRDGSKAKSWLFTTLYREFLGSHRRENRFPHVEYNEASHELPPAPATVVDSLDAHTMLEALTGLDELHRAPLTLFYLEQFSYAEIADVLDVPIGTVMSRLSRGKERLRKRLVEKQDQEPQKIVPLSPQQKNQQQ